MKNPEVVRIADFQATAVTALHVFIGFHPQEWPLASLHDLTPNWMACQGQLHIVP
jgi:hypothetical protein